MVIAKLIVIDIYSWLILKLQTSGIDCNINIRTILRLSVKNSSPDQVSISSKIQTGSWKNKIIIKSSF